MAPVLTRRPGRPRDQALHALRRAQILDAAARVFADKGFSDTDLEEVAARINLSKGSIYRYFRGKTTLFLATVDDGMRRLTQTIEAARGPDTDPLGVIAWAIRAYLEFFDREPHFAELLIQERGQFRDRKKHTYFEHRDANLGPWRELFQRLIDDGKIRDMPVDRIVNTLGDLLYGTMFTNRIAGRRQSVEEQWQTILDVLFLGILTEKYRKTWNKTNGLVPRQ